MKKCIRYSCFMLSLFFCAVAIIFKSFNIAIIGINILWLNNVIYSFEKIKQRLLFFIFNCTFYLFLLTRPTISMLRGNEWWYFTKRYVVFALVALFLGLLFLFVGSIIADGVIDREEKKKSLDIKNNNSLFNTTRKEECFLYSREEIFKKNLKLVACLVFAISYVAYMALEFEKLIFMQGRTYVEYYSDFSSKLPYFVYTISTFMKYSLCLFLAQKPKKHEAFIPLGLYLMSAVPSLLIGMRNPIMLAALFILMYYFIRDILEDKQKWIGRVEKTLIVVMTPVTLIGMGAFNYIRDGAKIATGNSKLALIVDLLYKQGVSFDVLCIGYGSIPDLPQRAFRNYTFGSFIDYFTHGTLAQKLLGAEDLGTGNNIKMALKSNSFAHNMSYVSRGKEYLEGHGWGSSYILETFADYGYIGIIISSILFGFILTYVFMLIKKSKFMFYIILISMTSIFFAPRAEATGWLTFILQIQFWIPTIACYIGASLCNREYSNRSLKVKTLKKVY